MAPDSARMRQVSRHTLVIRKAREGDAQRHDQAAGEREGAAASLTTRRVKAREDKPIGADREVPDTAGLALSSTVRSTAAAASTARARPSGRKVLSEDMRLGPELSTVTKFFGPSSMASLKTAGGNTIAQFDSGRRVVIRSSRRLGLRRRALLAYAAGYLLLFGLYGFSLLTGSENVAPEEFLRHAFPHLREGAAPAQETAALADRSGRRAPAEVRLVQPLSFQDRNNGLVRVEAGSRLTLETAVKLGEALHDDLARPPGARIFSKPFQVYRETWYARLDWPHWLAIYNSLGFFLLVVLFLWKPLLDYLAAQGSKTALAMHDVREAREEAGKFNAKYADMAAEVAGRRQELLAEAEAEAGSELAETLAAARRQATEIESGSKTLLELEAATLASRLGRAATIKACERAKLILERRLDASDHEAAIETLIADIANLRSGTILAD